MSKFLLINAETTTPMRAGPETLRSYGIIFHSKY